MTTGERRGAFGFALELAMIVIGVFLGTTAEQWRAGRADRDAATAALINFRSEATRNRERLRAVRAYHVVLADSLNLFLRSPTPPTLRDFLERSGFHGTRSVDFEHTAWDLALATQALAHVPPPLAYAVSQVYTRQQSFEVIEHDFWAGAFMPPTFADPRNGLGLAVSMSMYLGDVNTQEPALITLYDRLLPQLDSAIGPAGPASSGASPPNERRAP